MNSEAHVNEYREGFISYIWDGYKSIHGVRPRWMRFSEMSTRELVECCDQIELEVIESIEHDKGIAADLEARIAAANDDPNGFVWDTADEMDREYGIKHIKTYIIESAPINSTMADAMRSMMETV